MSVSRSRIQSGIVPVHTAILRRIFAVEDENFKVDGDPVSVVEIVARMIDMRNEGKRLELQLRDTFGTVDCVVYCEGDSYADNMILQDFVPKDGAYVRVIGQIRKFQDVA